MSLCVWLIKKLLPAIPKNSVIVLNNATFHKQANALLAVKEQGHTLPNLNPIEKK